MDIRNLSFRDDQIFQDIRWRQLNHHSRMNILVCNDSVAAGNERPVEAVSQSSYNGEVEDQPAYENDEIANESNDSSGYDIDYISSG